MLRFFLLILMSTNLYGQNVISKDDTIRLVHENYTSVFSKSKRYPIMVEWWVTKAKVTCKNPLKRSDDFEPDPLLTNETNLIKDYVNSGYDRGHMTPAADNLCLSKKVMDESFYFSNMAPQIHSLNAGDWKSLEVWTRETSELYDSVKVWCGNVGQLKKIGSVSVPEKCWKVIYIKKQNKWHYFVFDNIAQKQDGYKNNEINKTDLEKLIGFKDAFK